MHLRSKALFLFLCCLVLRGARSQKDQVQQMPRLARRVEGEAVGMNCTADFPGPLSITWVKDELAISQSVRMYLKRVSKWHKIIDRKQVSFLQIANLTECDSGTYYCKVDDMGKIVKSDGTNVAVTRAPQNVLCKPIHTIFIGVSAGVTAVLVIALIIVSLRLRRSMKVCLVLRRQFIKYFTEKSTEYMNMNEQKKHQPKGNAPSGSNQGRKKRKRKSQQSDRVENMQRGNFQ